MLDILGFHALKKQNPEKYRVDKAFNNEKTVSCFDSRGELTARIDGSGKRHGGF